MGRISTQHLVGRVSGVCGGRPTVVGTRIEVVDVLAQLGFGYTPEEVLEHYPTLKSLEQVYACCAYAALRLDGRGGGVTAPKGSK